MSLRFITTLFGWLANNLHECDHFCKLSFKSTSTLQLILVIYEQENREMPIFSLGLCNFPRIISILLSKNEENHAIAFALGKVYFAIKVFNFPLLFQKVEKWPKNVWKRSKISKQLLARKFKVKTFLKSLNCRIFKNCNFWRENSKSLLD